MKKTMVAAMVMSLVMFLAAAGVLWNRAQENQKNARDFDRVSNQLQEMVAANQPEVDDAMAQAEEADSLPQRLPRTLEETDDPVLLAYRTMAEEQPDLAGWVRIEGTMVDYPVMRSPDEAERYLHLNYDGEYSRAGTPFMLPVSDPSVPNDNIIVYGHHMKDGSMFAGLMEYEDIEKFRAQPYIQFDTLYERGVYKIVAVFRTSIGAENEFPYYLYEWLDTEEIFNRFMRGVAANQLYDTSETVVFGDQLISLSTCDYHDPDGRLIVLAKKIVETEEIDDAA